MYKDMEKKVFIGIDFAKKKLMRLSDLHTSFLLV
jgi:hypothetical protein